VPSTPRQMHPIRSASPYGVTANRVQEAICNQKGWWLMFGQLLRCQAWVRRRGHAWENPTATATASHHSLPSTDRRLQVAAGRAITLSCWLGLAWLTADDGTLF
jgi:hypothetical protein